MGPGVPASVSRVPEWKCPEVPVLASSAGLPPSSLRIHEPGLLSKLSLSKGPGGGRQPIAAEAQEPGPGAARGGRSSSFPARPPTPPPKNPGWRRTPSRKVTGLPSEAGVRAVDRGLRRIRAQRQQEEKVGTAALTAPHPPPPPQGCC